MSTTNTYTLNNYSVIVSLNERTIYLKITDTVSFYQYEGNIDIKELRLNVDLQDAYIIINNCFQDLDGYSVNIGVNSNMLKLQFNALVGGFLKMAFEIMLREKVMSNDGQLTINFNRLEQKLVAGLSKLEQRCQELEEIIEEKNSELLDLTDKLSNSQVVITYKVNPSYGFQLTNHDCFKYINTTNLELICDGSQNFIVYDSIKCFYNLKTLKITGINQTNLKNISNKSLKELIINSYSNVEFKSLEGIDKIPNLEKLSIFNAPHLTNIPTILNSYKHKINYIKIQSCSQVNVVELQTYCQTNNIKLDFLS